MAAVPQCGAAASVMGRVAHRVRAPSTSHFTGFARLCMLLCDRPLVADMSPSPARTPGPLPLN